MMTTTFTRRSSTAARHPLNTLAIPLGLTGPAEVWSIAARNLGLPVLLGEVFWIMTAIALVWTIAAHTIRGAQSEATLASQLQHPVQGPIAAIVPIIGMLLGGNLYEFWPAGGFVLSVISIIATALFAGWILSYWMRQQIDLENLHGGYFLPIVAGSFVTAGTASEIGLSPLANGALVVGLFFWAVMFALLFMRLVFRAPLPGALIPTMVIMLAPPAIAGAAWFSINGDKVDFLAEAFAAFTVVMALIQIGLLPTYRKLSFTLGFWSFSFPVAYAAAYAIEWLNVLHFAGWQAITIALVIVTTLLVVAIAYRSLAMVAADRRVGEPVADEQLSAADNDTVADTEEVYLAVRR